MAKLTYEEFFERHSDFYYKFHKLVNHAGNFRQEIEKQGYLEGVESVLSIGAGEGELELTLAKDLGVALGYIDPTPDFFESFNENANKLGLGKKIVEAFYGKFESFTPGAQYDLVLSIHSWYAFGLNREMLEKALSCLTTKGRLFITVVSKESVTWKLGEISRGVSGSNLSAEELSVWAKKEGFEHNFFINHKRIPYTRILKGDRLSIKGKAFASFLTFTPWTKMSEPLKKEVTELVKAHAESGIIDLKCGCLAFSTK